MQRTVRVTALATLAVLGSLSQSHAADMPTLRGTIHERPQMAPEPAGFYVGARGGISAPRDVGVVSYPASPGPPPTQDLRFDVGFKNGIAGSGFAGYDFGWFMPGVGARVEAELGFFGSTVRRVTVANTSGGANPQPSAAMTFTGNQTSGTANSYFALANYFVDFDLGSFRPFVGAGLGVAQVNFRNVSYGGIPALSTDGTGWAYQMGAGLAFTVTPNIVIEASYRYLAVRDIEVTAVSGQPNRVNLATNQANLGVRWRF